MDIKGKTRGEQTQKGKRAHTNQSESNDGEYNENTLQETQKKKRS